MQEILILAIGKAGRRPETAIAEDYLKRLPLPARLLEFEERRPLPAPERQKREAERQLAALPPGALLIALDEAGEALDSQGFAARLGVWRDSGRPLAFAIGGADGLGTALLERAEARISLSAMTWPHMLVRPMLAEQLYRGFSILAGHPYHRA